MRIIITRYDERMRPDLHTQQETVLADRPLSRKIATRTVPRDRRTGQAHHEALTIKTWRKSKGVCTEDGKHTVTLEGDEVQALVDFIAAARSIPDDPRRGTFTIDVSPGQGDWKKGTAEPASDPQDNGQGEALVALLRQAADRPEVLRAVLERSAEDRDFLARAASALNLAVYEAAVADLERL